MSKIQLFSHNNWPGCNQVKEFLSQKGVEFTYHNVSESIAELKAWLKIRDTHPEYAQIRESYRSVGFPCVVVNDGEKVILGFKEEALAEL